MVKNLLLKICFSFFISNAVIFLFFNGNDDPYLNQSTRRQMIIILASVVIGAIIMFSLLRNPIRQNQVDELHLTSLGELKDIGRTMISKDTLPDNFIYILAGFHITFVNVMRSSFGFTEYLSDNSKLLIPLSGVTQNIGDIIGCIFTVWLGKRSILKLRIIPIACIVTMVTSIMVFLALPNSSAFTYTDQKPMIEFSIYFIMMANVLVGFGGQCLHIEIMNYLGYMHPHKCAPSLVHKEFMQNVGMAISFYYSSYLGLQIQSAIFMLFSILAACAFYGSWNKSYLPDDGKNAKSKKYTVNKMGSV